ncbi:protein timeless homolog [Phlebotomus argentipes]|uniref:protein timeless homolog n=1 Tax=Phlebotomus argentipes TaxID=94469 RepID=UPI0028929F52|nr:protein timeless homolog [Phlebotomus argentipes]
MSRLLADIDATCASLGLFDGERYISAPDSLSSLKHLIWILRRDNDTHEYRRHIGQSSVLRTDLLPMLVCHDENSEYFDVLLRLLLNLTCSSYFLYHNEVPKDKTNHRFYLELNFILRGYKEAFADEFVWIVLKNHLQKLLETTSMERNEEQELIIERILVLLRNVLQIPSSTEAEGQHDGDTLHDQILWALQQSGMTDIILFVLSSNSENQYHFHVLEVMYYMLHEQAAEALAQAKQERTSDEKEYDNNKLRAVRCVERDKSQSRTLPGRHSRFGGTYVLRNIKSVSEKDVICHQSLEKAFNVTFDAEKKKKRHTRGRILGGFTPERRSLFAIRIHLRQFCIQLLHKAYNPLIRQIKRILDSNPHSSAHDDSYLFWAIRFFMEFNRFNGFRLDLVSETVNVQTFHWILTRIQESLDVLQLEKKNFRPLAKKLHIRMLAFRECLLTLCTMQTLTDDANQCLSKQIQNNIFYVMEFREMVLHLMLNYKETQVTKSYLIDTVQMAHLFMRMFEKFCQGTVFVQCPKSKAKKRAKKSKNRPKKTSMKSWGEIRGEIHESLTKELAKDDSIIPFDATSSKPIDDQSEDCMRTIFSLLHGESYERAVLYLRAAREVWPNAAFGEENSSVDDDLEILKAIYLANLEYYPENDNENDYEEDNESEADEENYTNFTEKQFNFDDFAKRLLNPRATRLCVLVLLEWKTLSANALLSVVTVLHRVAVKYKMPKMLYQASLFRVFQEVLHAPRETRHEELRRLATFIVRRFTQDAEKNAKIYAELFFYKTLRDCDEESYASAGKGRKGKKAPGPNANDQSDDDNEIEPVESGAISPRRPSIDGEISSMDRSGMNQDYTATREPQLRLRNENVDTANIREIAGKLKAQFKSAIHWLQETLQDEIQEMSQNVPEDDEDNAVPLVPLFEEHKVALESVEFQELLTAMGMLQPLENEIYWRIPNNIAVEELQSRCDLLSDGNGLQCNKRVRSDIDISCPEVEEGKTNEPIDDGDDVIDVRKRRKIHNVIDSEEEDAD